MVRANGLLVFLPGVGGPSTYGTYLVPNELGRAELDRFVLFGNPIQINFLPPSELPRGFAQMEEQEKLEQFFKTEERHLSKSFGRKIAFTDLKASNFQGVAYLAGFATLELPDGTSRELRLTARTAGLGILHAAYQPENRTTASKARAMVERLLRSFELVPRPLSPDEFTKLSKESQK